MPTLLHYTSYLTPETASGSTVNMNPTTAVDVTHRFELAIMRAIIQASYDLKTAGEVEMAKRVDSLYLSGRTVEVQELIRSYFMK